ncbi:hypothetical protein ACM66B_001763 [Microbotryomycetes sp. NB124-2]
MTSLNDMTISVKTLVEVVFVSAVVYAVVTVSKSRFTAQGQATQTQTGSEKSKKKHNKKKGKRDEAQSVGKGENDVPGQLDEGAERVEQHEKDVKSVKKQLNNVKGTNAKLKGNDKAQIETKTSSKPADSETRQPSATTRLTAAEKYHKPLPETSTSDMRDKDVDPDVKVARVMKLVGGKVGSQPEPEQQQQQQDERDWDRPRGWDDDVQADEGAWETTSSLKKPNKSNQSSSSSSFSLSNPTPTRSIPGLSSTQTSLTKKQRENQSKAQKQSLLKQQAEKDRLERLAQHRKGLEKIRMVEQERERNKGKPKSGPRSENFGTSVGSSKTLSGGMSAQVDLNGKLIWD